MGLAPRTAAYAGEGAAYGGLQAAGETVSDNPEDYAQNAKRGALTGAAIGGAIPSIGKAVGAAYQAVAPFLQKAVPDVSRKASGLMETAARADRDALPALKKLGPEATLADAGPSLLGLAQGVATKPGEGRTALVSSLEARNAGRNARLAEDVNANLGIAESPVAMTQTLRDARKVITGPLYTETFASAPSVDATRAVAAVAQKLSKAEGPEAAALQRIKDMLVSKSVIRLPSRAEVKANPDILRTIPGIDRPGMMESVNAAVENGQRSMKVPVPKTDAERLHNIKVAIDTMIEYGEPGLGVVAGAVNKQQGAVKEVRRLLNETLEKQVPGYANANAKSSEYAKLMENIEDGGKALAGGKEAVWPQDLQARWNALTPAQQAAFRLGTRGDIENRIGTQANDLAAVKKSIGGDRDWNRDKMETVFGDKPTQKVIDAVGREQRFADTHTNVAGNSQTAARLASSKAVDGAEPYKVPLDITVTGLGARSLQAIGNGVMRLASANGATNVRDELGRMLSATGAERQKIVDDLMRSGLDRVASRRMIEKFISSPALLFGRQTPMQSRD
jgi:uncharacterized protein (UPF0218 family)